MLEILAEVFEVREALGFKVFDRVSCRKANVWQLAQSSGVVLFAHKVPLSIISLIEQNQAGCIRLVGND